MAYEKRYFVLTAFEEIGMASYAFDLQPDQLQAALNRLDGMMAMWDQDGIRLGYPIPNGPDDSSLDDEFDPPYYAVAPIWQNLAIAIAPSFGKSVSAETKLAASNGYSLLAQVSVQPVEMRYPSSMPSGAGNKYWRNQNNPFINQQKEPLLAGTDGPIFPGTLPINNDE